MSFFYDFFFRVPEIVENVANLKTLKDGTKIENTHTSQHQTVVNLIEKNVISAQTISFHTNL